MTKNYFIKNFVSTFGLCLLVVLAKAQIPPWINYSTGPNSFNQPDNTGAYPNIESIGIGDFQGMSGTPPLSALDLNSNYLPLSNNFTPGEVFRTSCPQDISTYWRLRRISSETGTDMEYGSVYSLSANDDYSNTGSGQGFHFYVQSGYSFVDDNHSIYGDIRFNTGYDASNSPYAGYTFPRMRIVGSNGRVGIGDYTTFIPQELLHIHESSDNRQDVYAKFTNSTTNPNAADGFKVGITTIDAHLIQQEDAPIHFSTFDNTGNLQERVRMTYNLGQSWPYGSALLGGVTKVNINYGSSYSPITVPVALLNLGENPPVGIQPGGQRTWMDVGTFNCLQTDDAYFGLKREGQYDHFDAVVGWGDNINAPDGADNLRFVFTAPLGLAGSQNAGSVHGLEVLRATPIGHIGIGNFTTVNGSGIQPSRRLEIYDEHVDPYIGTPAPQLRLTYLPATTAPWTTTGTWTDLQTTNNGDLYIHPTTGGTNANVGINTSSPQKTLEINSNNASASPGNSGLRLTDLTTSSTPVTPSPWASGNHCVLTVDANGDVILVKDDDQAGTGTVTACGGAAGVPNYITKFTSATDICTSTIWEDGASPHNVGIGTITPQYKLNNTGTAMFAQSALTSALTQSITRPYPLAVQSFNTGANGTGYAGLAVFGTSTYSDELNIFVDANNKTCFENQGNITNFYQKTSGYNNAGISMLGFNPATFSTMVMDNFSTSGSTISPPTFSNTRFYVESQDHGNTIVPYAAWANNRSNDNVTSNASSYGFRAESSNQHDQTNMQNIGAHCIGANASAYNIGISAVAYNTCSGCTAGNSIAGKFDATGPNDNTGLKVLVQNNFTFGTSILNYGEDMVVSHNGDNTTNYGHNVLLYGSDNSTINVSDQLSTPILFFNKGIEKNQILTGSNEESCEAFVSLIFAKVFLSHSKGSIC